MKNCYRQVLCAHSGTHTQAQRIVQWFEDRLGLIQLWVPVFRVQPETLTFSMNMSLVSERYK